MYVELHAHSSYSFLDGASLPEELAIRAAEHGYPSFALTDHDNVCGAMEFTQACKSLGVRPILGAELTAVASVTQKCNATSVARISRFSFIPFLSIYLG